MVVAGPVTTEGDLLDGVDAVDELLGPGRDLFDLPAGRAWLPLQQHDVLDHLPSPPRIAVSRGGTPARPTC
jgi:hypothetical protein